jgi:hypothetical protein
VVADCPERSAGRPSYTTFSQKDVPAVAHEIEYFIDEAIAGNYTSDELAAELRLIDERGRVPA